MKKEILKRLIDLIDDNDTETIFRVLIRFVAEDTPLPDEVNAIMNANIDLETNGSVSHNDIDWN